MKVEVHIWFLFFIKFYVIIPCIIGGRISDNAVTNDDAGILICGSFQCPNGTTVCVVKKKSTDDLKNVTRKSTCYSSNGTNLAEMTLMEQNLSGGQVNLTTSSIIGDALNPPPPQAAPQIQPQTQPMQQTINDIISSITNTIAQASTTAAASPPPNPPQNNPQPTVISIMSPPNVMAVPTVSVVAAQPVVAPYYGSYTPTVFNYVYSPPPAPDQVLSIFGALHAATDLSGDYYPNPWQQNPVPVYPVYYV